jgi:predicted transcriptional regulator
MDRIDIIKTLIKEKEYYWSQLLESNDKCDTLKEKIVQNDLDETSKSLLVHYQQISKILAMKYQDLVQQQKILENEN